MKEKEVLRLQNVTENNLKNLSLAIEHDQIVTVCGVSGSGKSTLAFDTIYAEGGRRYIETFSPYTRQFLDRLHRPTLDSISGVRPALALEQRNRITSSRSTVGTVSEINDYLKLLWSHLSELHCPNCDTLILPGTTARTSERLFDLASSTKADLLLITFAIPLTATASLSSIAGTLSASGFVRYFDSVTGKAKSLDSLQEPGATITDKQLLVVVDRMKLPISKSKELVLARLRASISQAFSFGKGKLIALLPTTNESVEKHQFIEGLRCASCEKSFPKPKPALFSFNSPIGACSSCHGFGKVLLPDPELCVPDQNLSINDGAIACLATNSSRREFAKLKEFARETGIGLDKPWNKLSKQQKGVLFTGVTSKSSTGFNGINPWFEKLLRKRHKMHVRVFLSRYRSEFTCTECQGNRLKDDALQYSIDGKTLPNIWKLPLGNTLEFFERLSSENADDHNLEAVCEEVTSRLRYLVDIGLGYLTLDRQSRSLSGGESQRVNLTSILGSRLVNTMLVLDEPTIGLHPRDTDRLLDTLKTLKNRGNTVILVEHDQDVIRASDSVIDLGPKAGKNGGEIVYQGSVANFKKCTSSLTSQYLFKSQDKNSIADTSTTKISKSSPTIEIKGATAHNLKNIDVAVPLGGLVVVTGVSGSGKSSLLTECLHSPFRKHRQGVTLSAIKNSADIPISSLKGLDRVDDIVLIDQNPIGKSPRSNAATYTKAWEHIRETLAETPAAVQLGLSKSAFSFNVDGGRCPECKGAGQVKIEMQFLADVYVQCDACGGSRFQDNILGVRLADKNVIEILAMSLDETIEFFEDLGESTRAHKVLQLLRPLIDLGLGYLTLGHPLNAVSGGEAQRIKLASYCNPGFQEKCLFILDEPTTGLHPHNIVSLLSALRKLIDHGHSIVCIEHNLDVISSADWILDIGPEAGEHGGTLVVSGSPRELIKGKSKSHTAELLRKHVGAKTESRTKKSAAKKQATEQLPRLDQIEVLGATQNNLKNLSVTIPHNQLSVVTGVSGSGKSTLAFDIVFAEGQRRYIDCLSPYARQYIKQLGRADVDQVNAIPPTIAVSQKTAPPMGVSTIATTTEIYQYLRLLFSKVGTQHCIVDDTEIGTRSPEAITKDIAKDFKGERILIFAPVVSGRKGYYTELFNRALRAEISEALIDGSLVSLHPELRLERHKLHWISLAVGSISKPKANDELLKTAVEQALVLGNGVVEVYRGDVYSEPRIYNIDRACTTCGRGYRDLDPQDFSFRSARGVCQGCSGTGRIEIKGSRETKVCHNCDGARIAAIGRHVRIDGKRIQDLTAMCAPELLGFLSKWRYPKRLSPVIEPVLKELKSVLAIVTSVGLDYLSLDRDAFSISGGEAQRLRLAKTLGSPLSGVCYVLDEPSIGLHPSDHGQLMNTLFGLRDAGNTVVVVEHDEETILSADYIVDIGPGGGAEGGNLVIAGSVDSLIACSESETGRELRERELARCKVAVKKTSTPKVADCIQLKGATANNLKSVNIQIPLNKLTAVAGVSGAGKSSLIHKTLVPAIVEEFEGEVERAKYYGKTWSSLNNIGNLERLIEIDQAPVGKTSTSTPSSYLGIFTEIRKLFALLPDAKSQGWTASHFSFNTGKGRCSECQGKGYIKVPMSFLPDAVTSCELCNGLRYNDETLELRYQDISIGELLQKTFSEAREILAAHKKISRVLDYVLELGLGYLTLGQPTHTLSGGEAQRIKIAKELGAREAKDTLYILDEPTIGLHMRDVSKLQSVLQKLVNLGNTVVVIEHNLDILRESDYLIELGPGPGDTGGTIVFEGTLAQLARSAKKSKTKEHLFAIEKKDTSNGKQSHLRSHKEQSLRAKVFAAGNIR